MKPHFPELEPISEAQPAGADVRYDPEFERLQAEIDKLSMPSSTGSTDWETVKSLSTEILRNQSKDILVAGYLAAAEIRVNGLEGFLAGLQVFGGLLEEYWDTLYPAKKRMRGRVAAIEWWLEKCEEALADVQAGPQDPDFVEELSEGVQRIDELLNGYLDDAPMLRPLVRVIEELPQGKSNPGLAGPVAEEEKEGRSASQPEVENTPAPGQQGAVPKVEEAPRVESTSSMSAAEMEQILRGALKTIGQAASFYLEKDLADPRAYRCRRIAGWTLIQSIPPATDGQTQVPAPGECADVKKRLNEYRAAQQWVELLRESETRLPNALLWLDLNRFTAEALNGLGAQYQEAHDAVCAETALLVARLNGLDKMAYADGTPFADAETKQWLEEIKPGGGESFQAPAMQGGTVNERMEEVLERANSLASAKKMVEALNLVMDEMTRSSGEHEGLLWRLGLAQLLMNYRQTRLALPHLEEIVRTVDSFNLERWDPVLAAHALRMVWLGYRSEKVLKIEAEAVLGRIARIDPAGAMRLDKK